MGVERIISNTKKLKDANEKQQTLALFSKNEFTKPIDILKQADALAQLRYDNIYGLTRKTTNIFNEYAKTKDPISLNYSNLLSVIFSFSRHKDKVKNNFEIYSWIRESEISDVISSLNGVNLEFISNNKNFLLTRKILPTYFLLRSFKENGNKWLGEILSKFNKQERQELITNVIDLKNELISFVNMPLQKKTIIKKFKNSLEIERIERYVLANRIEVKNQQKKLDIEKKLLKRSNEVKYLPQLLSKIYSSKLDSIIDEIFGIKIPKEKPSSYEIYRKIFSLSSNFKDADYLQKAALVFNEVMPDIEDKGIILKLSEALRKSYFDIFSNKNLTRLKLDAAMNEEFIKPGDFSKINILLYQILFKNFQSNFQNLENFNDFKKINGINEMVDSVRKLYLILNIKDALPKKNREFIIIPEYKSGISINEIRGMLLKKSIKNLFDDGQLNDFVDLGDEELVTHYLFLKIENQIKVNEEQFNERKVIKRNSIKTYFNLPKFIDPNGYMKTIHDNKKRIPISSIEVGEDDSNTYILLYSHNRPITKIDIKKFWLS